MDGLLEALLSFELYRCSLELVLECLDDFDEETTISFVSFTSSGARRASFGFVDTRREALRSSGDRLSSGICGGAHGPESRGFGIDASGIDRKGVAWAATFLLDRDVELG